MECDTCRESLSARLDGEVEPRPAEAVDAHLAQCAACATWHAQAQAVTRMIRVRPAEPVPDLVASVLSPPRALPVALPQRLALMVVALVQLGLALSQLLTGASGGHAGHDLAGHLFNEGAAWNLALGVGLLVASLRADRAAGLLPTLIGFVGVLVAFSVRDLVAGTATVERVASHLPVVTGLVLLFLVSRAVRAEPTPGARVPGSDEGAAGEPAAGEPTRRTGRDGKPRHLRPTAKRAA
ncbi:zf-HC2 domain-containing protein [Actinokineospora auranticolor]|uniref:Putative anti-sigma-YlaC factor YlaD n=1 Tax=Actinokineospora auranticolor TaxID=155976 RepID=A0A2S6GK61_9PSEU|nr:zf-HC2 domain-containing protein [Actinokineospora auranticolor]PPK65607.1 putative anti-sigma-YlaC factor YlaD [Actinokineospora auranticolor]